MWASLSDREWRFLETIVFFVLFAGGVALISVAYMRVKSESTQGGKMWIKTIVVFSGGAWIVNLATGLLFALHVFEPRPLLLSLATAMTLLSAGAARFLVLGLKKLNKDTEPSS